MSEIWYTATESFDSRDGESWTNYIQWSRLSQLKRLISLDDILCPSIVRTLTDEDWNHNVHEDYHCFFFRDLEYLLSRQPLAEVSQVLAVMLEPGSDPRAELKDNRFSFAGFDLLDKDGMTSALSNCGGFPLAFDNEELTENGLVESYERARRVQDLLRENYREEAHADCHVWAIWLMEGAA